MESGISRPAFSSAGYLRRVQKKYGVALTASFTVLAAFSIAGYFLPALFGIEVSDWRNFFFNLLGAIMGTCLLGEAVDKRREHHMEAAAFPLFQKCWADTLPATFLICAAWFVLNRLNPTSLAVDTSLLTLLGLRIPSHFVVARPIELTAAGLSQAGKHGQPFLLPYAQVQAITFDKYGNTHVVGPTMTIVHSRVHLAPELFRAWVSHLSGQPVSGPTPHRLAVPD